MSQPVVILRKIHQRLHLARTAIDAVHFPEKSAAIEEAITDLNELAAILAEPRVSPARSVAMSRNPGARRIDSLDELVAGQVDPSPPPPPLRQPHGWSHSGTVDQPY